MAGNPTGIIIRPISATGSSIRNFAQRLFQPPSETIRGIDSNDWYSPLQPVKPIAPPGTEPRAFQYWAGQNLLYTPRADAEYSAARLKELSMYPLARICIENVKDSLCKIPWEIQAKVQPGETPKQAQKRSLDDQNLLNINKFFERPDREHDFEEWLRLLLEDMLVIDAMSVLIRKTFKGQIAELAPIRGETIVRYIDTNGFTPQPPSPAYAQNWWGIPLVDLTTDQLVYRPRNIVPRNTIASQLYGTSPTECIAREIEIGIERLNFIYLYYKEGSIPGVVQFVPRGVDPDEIMEAMEWMNSELAGNLAARQQWRMMQGWTEKGGKDEVLLTKEPLLSDPFDDQHMRRLAFAYGTSPQRLAKAMNRASGEQADDSASIEGLLPFLRTIKGLIDYIIQQKFGYVDYEWVADPSAEPDPQKNAATITELVSKAVLTPNEGRQRLGEEPRDEPEADMLGVIGATGFAPIGMAAAQAQATYNTKDSTITIPPPPAPKPSVGEAAKILAESAKGIDLLRKAVRQISIEDDAPAPARLSKAVSAKVKIDPANVHKKTARAKIKLESTLLKVFRRQKEKAIAAVERSRRQPVKKAADDNTVERRDQILRVVYASIEDEFRTIPPEAREALEQAARAGVSMAIDIGISDVDVISEVNEEAADYAADRAAEMIGMKYGADGELIPNPDAKWAISDTTRDELRTIIENAFKEATPFDELVESIRDAGMFSAGRAETIARTETSRAQVQSQFNLWNKSGLVKSVEWQCAGNDPCDKCEPNDGEIRPIGAAFPSGDVMPLVHPSCYCLLIAREISS